MHGSRTSKTWWLNRWYSISTLLRLQRSLLCLSLSLLLLLPTSSHADNREHLKPIPVIEVHTIELNHYINPTSYSGPSLLDQLIFRDRWGVIIDYKVIKESREQMTREEYQQRENAYHKELKKLPEWEKVPFSEMPPYIRPFKATPAYPTKSGDLYQCITSWRGGSGQVKIVAKHFFRTWTYFDREVKERDGKAWDGLNLKRQKQRVETWAQ